MKPSTWLNNLAQINFDPENDEARLEHITRVVILLMAGTVLSFTPIVLFVIFSDPEPFDWYGVTILGSLVLPLAFAWILIRLGHWKIARNIPIIIFLILGINGLCLHGIGTTFILFFVLVIILAGIYYSINIQVMILIFIIFSTNLIEWLLTQDIFLVVSAGITFSGLLIGVWLLQLMGNNLLARSLNHQKVLTTQLRVEVTERIKAEEQMADINHMLEERVHERTTQLEAANQELQAVSYSIAHDLRAPIRAIIGLNEMVLQDHADQLDQDVREYLDKTIAASSKMDSMLEGLLNLLSLGSTEISITQLDLSQMAEEILHGLTADLQVEDISFKVLPTPPANADPQLVIELLAQLITNALKFSKPGTPLEIEFGAEERAGKTAYYLKDNGIGINMDYADLAFDPFISLNERELYAGSGIGLTIARRIIRLHKGKIWVESEEQHGATFFFTL